MKPHADRRARATALVALLALALLGAPGRGDAGVLNYLRDRGEDLLDVVRLRFISPHRAEGYGLKARATALAQAGYVHTNGLAYGMDRRAIGVTAERRTEGGIGPFYFSRTQMARVAGRSHFDPESPWNLAHRRGVVRNLPAWDDGRLHPLSIGAEAQIGLFGLDLGVYPTEALDFVTGWLFFDIYKDDQTYVDSLPLYGVAPEAQVLTDLENEPPPSAEPEPRADGRFLLEEPPAQEGAAPADPTLGSSLVTQEELNGFFDPAAAQRLGIQPLDAPAEEPGAPPAEPPEAENPPASETPPAAPPSAPAP